MMSNPFQGIAPKKSYGRKSVGVNDSFPKIMAQADIVFSKWVRKRALNKSYLVQCYTCDAQMRLAEADCGHFIDRRHTLTRYSEINCNAQCKNCNQDLDGNKEIYRENLIRDYGTTVVEALEALAYSQMKLSRLDLLEIIEKYSK